MAAGMAVLLEQAPPVHAQPVRHEKSPMHVVQTLLTQKEVLQSAAPEQLFPTAQRKHTGPPQSTSLSLPFLTV